MTKIFLVAVDQLITSLFADNNYGPRDWKVVPLHSISWWPAVSLTSGRLLKPQLRFLNEEMNIIFIVVPQGIDRFASSWCPGNISLGGWFSLSLAFQAYSYGGLFQHCCSCIELCWMLQLRLCWWHGDFQDLTAMHPGCTGCKGPQ